MLISSRTRLGSRRSDLRYVADSFNTFALKLGNLARTSVPVSFLDKDINAAEFLPLFSLRIDLTLSLGSIDSLPLVGIRIKNTSALPPFLNNSSAGIPVLTSRPELTIFSTAVSPRETIRRSLSRTGVASFNSIDNCLYISLPRDSTSVVYIVPANLTF